MINVYVSQQRVIGNHGEQHDTLDIRWFEFLMACGLLPILLPNDPNLTRKILLSGQASAAVLTGGGLFDMLNDNSRSQTELALLKWSAQSNSPLIGVCRGMQAILLANGATLMECEDQVRENQDIIFMGEIRNVNSYHNYSCKNIPTSFNIIGHSTDDIIKAILSKKRPILGIMWHPERLTPFKEQDKQMFFKFITQGYL